ncbi:MAG: type II toxin-antitoxin system antitoxin, RelB/DinJ family [Defluviitaleaceae bacterium]|nr:type II toxin-antitoxin system antitoxin, RelB/DinJ family [Defluviitaleaceae bacterium]MCL2273462.1 type II toxin-antitoxin system antitoxin, RelB/DinJ family [Defluviitaleaceae bacterium]
MVKTSVTKTANINVRLYPELKTAAENVFTYHGLSLPDAITVFFSHACRVGGFSFELKGARWNDPVSLAALQESNEILANPNAYKSYHDVSELFADCLNGEDDDD